MKDIRVIIAHHVFFNWVVVKDSGCTVLLDNPVLDVFDSLEEARGYCDYHRLLIERVIEGEVEL